ncbi:MAG: glycosyltransferase family 39 protein [Acidobacteriota bacterium]
MTSFVEMGVWRKWETTRRWSRPSVCFLLLLSLCQYLTFSGSFTYFFQGDSVFWLSHRFTSWSEFLPSFLSLDSHGWYRPLAHRLIPSLFFPLFGLHVFGYHLVVFGLFVVTTWLVFIFLRELARNDLEAALGTSFFGLHSIQVYTTFDFAFEPELIYGFFYLCSTLSFLRHQQTGRRRYSLVSGSFFALSLVSKEAALSLPLNLLLVKFLFFHEGATAGSGKWTVASFCQRIVDSARALSVHLALLAFYLGYVFLYLRKGDLLLRHVARSNYTFELGNNVLSNLLHAFLWAFNLPSGWHTRWRHLPEALYIVLGAFALFHLAYLFWSLPSRRRNPLPGFALGWFVIGLLPALFLRDLRPYYLYVPLMGFSLLVGRGLGFACTPLFRGGRLRRALILVPLAALWLACWMNIEADRRHHPLLGPSSQTNLQAVQDLRRARPKLAPGSTIVLVGGDGASLWWHYASGDLFRLLYGDDSIKVVFLSLGDTISEEALAGGTLLVMKYDNGHLEEVTDRFKANPGDYIATEAHFSYIDSPPGLIQIDRTEVQAGQGYYTLHLRGFKNERVEIQYQINEGPLAAFKAFVDSDGEFAQFVSAGTRKGHYRFLAIRGRGDSKWSRSTPVSLHVR